MLLPAHTMHRVKHAACRSPSAARFAFLQIYMQLSKNNVRAKNLSPLQIGGGERVRTDDPLRARQVLSQLSYTPDKTVISFEFLVFSFKCL